MTNRERTFAAIGFEYADGIDNASTVVVPGTNRLIVKNADGKWLAWSKDGRKWDVFDDLLDAATFVTADCEEGGDA